MVGQLKVTFEVADVDAEERVIREYVAPAFERLCERGDAHWPAFNRYGNDPVVDAGRVVFLVFGDVDAIVDDERSHWEELVADGLVIDWQIDEPGVDTADLDEREELRYRLRSVASRMSLEFFDAFDELPDALDEFDNEEYQIGGGFCLHHIINQLGYQANDGEEEIDILFRCLTGRLHALAVSPGTGVEAAEEKISELTAELGSLSAELYRRHGDHGR